MRLFATITFKVWAAFALWQMRCTTVVAFEALVSAGGSDDFFLCFVEATLEYVRAEYNDVPNLRLTPSQAQRWFHLEPPMCATMLDALLLERLLSRTADGLFVRSVGHD